MIHLVFFNCDNYSYYFCKILLTYNKFANFLRVPIYISGNMIFLRWQVFSVSFRKYRDFEKWGFYPLQKKGQNSKSSKRLLVDFFLVKIQWYWRSKIILSPMVYFLQAVLTFIVEWSNYILWLFNLLKVTSSLGWSLNSNFLFTAPS